MFPNNAALHIHASGWLAHEFSPPPHTVEGRGLEPLLTPSDTYFKKKTSFLSFFSLPADVVR